VNPYYPAAGVAGEYYLYFLDYHQPEIASFDLPAGARFAADVIDPWTMTVAQSPGTYSGKFELKMPGRPYQAVRFRIV
jgi:hypothetical protein